MLNINKFEWRLVGAVSLFFMLLTGVMIWLGYYLTPEGFFFLNLQSINTGDTAVYYSWIEQAKDGYLLMWNLYTPDEHPRFLLDIFWAGVGFGAKIFSLSAIAAYNLARFILIPILAIVLYGVIAYFFENKKTRRWAYLFTIFSSGVGAYAFLLEKVGLIYFGQTAMDLWVPEAFTFLNFYHSPHFMFSYALLLATLVLFLIGFEKKSWRYTLAAGLTGLMLFQFHPYHGPTVFSILIVFGVVLIVRRDGIPWDYVRRGFVLGLFSLPAIAYHYWTLQEFFIRQQHAAQNITTTSHPIMTLIAFGFLGLTAIAGLLYIIVKKDKTDKEAFLATWMIVQMILIYIPVNYQRRLTEGLQVVMAIIAVIGLLYVREYLKEKGYWKRPWSHPALLIGVFVVLFAFTNIFVVYRDVKFIQNGGPYISEARMNAFRWINENTPEQSVIFSSYYYGNLQPAFGVRQSYLAHWGMTAKYEKRARLVDRFFQPKVDSELRADFLVEESVDYLLISQEEIEASEMDPYDMDFMEVFKNDEMIIFQVLENEQ